MQRTIGIALAGACLVVVMLEWTAEAEPRLANYAIPAGANSAGLITHVQENEGRPTRVIVIDPQRQTMCVYDVLQDTGEIQPKSFRNLSWDFQVEDFNTGEPLPGTFRNRIHQK
jgi:hypothetical protein